MIDIQQLFALSPLIVVSTTAILLLLLIAFLRHHHLNATFAVIGLNVALVATLLASQVAPQLVTDLLVIDPYSCFFTALMVIGTLASCTYAHTWLQSQRGPREEMYLLMLLSLAGGIVLASSRHFAALFIGLEMLSIPLYGLAAYKPENSRSLEAGIKYLVLSATASALMLFGIALVYARFGSLSFAIIGEQMAAMNDHYDPAVLSGIILVTAALAFKLSMVPFHLWTPDVYEGAPAPTGTFLATTAKLAVAAVFLRLVAHLPIFSHESMRVALMLLTGFSILVGNLLAMVQNNIKRLLGYSSIAHFGYLAMGLTAMSPALTPASWMVYLTSYLLATLAAFGVVTIMSTRASGMPDGDASDLFRYRGLYWQQPLLAVVLAIAMLSLAGIPATIGFIGKFYVILAAVSAGLWWLLGAMIVGSAIGLYFYLRVIISLFLPAGESPVIVRDWSHRASMVVLALLAFAILALGIFPQDLLSLAASAELM